MSSNHDPDETVTDAETPNTDPDLVTMTSGAENPNTDTDMVTMTTSMGYYQNLLELIDDANIEVIVGVETGHSTDTELSEMGKLEQCLPGSSSGDRTCYSTGDEGTSSAVNVETLDYIKSHEPGDTDEAISTIWEMRYLDHAALVGRFMAEDLVIAHELEEEDEKKGAKREKETPPKEYQCVFHTCKIKFASRHQRLYHYIQVHKEIQLQCPECNKIFVTKQQLETHVRGHFNIKPYCCDYKDCNKKFLTAQHLRNHKLVHTGDKTFECDICNQRFREKNSLNRHVRSHTKVKSYKCDVCQRMFSHASSRNVHRKNFHSNIPTYIRNLSDKRSKSSKSSEVRDLSDKPSDV